MWKFPHFRGVWGLVGKLFLLYFPNLLSRSHLVVRSAEAWQEPPLVTQVDLVEKLL